MNIKKIASNTLQFIINRLIEIIGVCISLIGSLFLIALVSYSPSDPNFIFPENTEIQNIFRLSG
jgi:S-DNA-T family DNA segregation ATPase FtsK/SpoIIIE